MNLDDVAPCGRCGGLLLETHHPSDEDGPEFWTYQCAYPACGNEYGNNRECTERLTMRTAPWTQALAAEVDRLWGALEAT